MLIAQVSAQGAAQAEQALRPYFPDVRMGTGDQPFSFELEGHSAWGVTALAYDFEAPDMRVKADGAGFAATQTRVAGQFSHGNDPVDLARPFVFSEPVWCVASRVTSRVIQFDPKQLRNYARRELGDDGFMLREKQIGPTTAAGAALWARTATYAMAMFRSGAFDDPLIGARLSELLSSVYLQAFPTNWSEQRGPRDGQRAVPANVRRARVFIDDNFASPITVAQMAAAAGLSVRGLQAAFRRTEGMSPAEYLKRVRLDAARRRLLNSSGQEGETVAAVARSAGFPHASRFAAAYRAEFGESPLVTLKT